MVPLCRALEEAVGPAVHGGRWRQAGGATIAVALLCLSGCSDAGPVAVASLTVAPSYVYLHLADTMRLEATPHDAHGEALSARPVTWTSQDESVVTVSDEGLVTAVDLGSTTVTAACEGRIARASVAVALAPVARVDVTPSNAWILAGGSLQFSASPKDSTGATAHGWPIYWASSDTVIARVSATGLATGYALGPVSITAAAGGRSGAATVLVWSPSGDDITIQDAQFTQAIQTPTGSIPMVLGGNGAVVNVLIGTTRGYVGPIQFLLRLSDSTGALAWSDTVTLPGLQGLAPQYDAPSAQFFVPASTLRPGLRWQVVRDPLGLLPDDSAANDRFPRTGPAALATADVPTLKIRFVPIVLAAHGNLTGQVTTADLSAYLTTVRSILPVGPLSVSIGQPLATQAGFGTPPSGGAAAFWQQVLSDVDLARLADPIDRDAHWIGVVAPPAGYTTLAYGGYAYIPSSYEYAGANTRSAVVIRIGYSNRASYTPNTVAHELGHNFGRWHAPCGLPASPDPSFPDPYGRIGDYGHDVFSLALGLTATAVTISREVGDLMGYCSPMWSSTYTFQGILAFRGRAAATTAAPAAPGRVLVVRGTVEDGNITLQPAIALTAAPSLPEREGPYVLDGVAEDGSILFHYAFEPATLDHSPARPFTIAIPLTSRIDSTLEEIRVRGPAGERTLTRAAPGVAPPGRAAASLREAGGTVRLVCADAGARAVAVQDAASGALLGTGEGAALSVLARSGTPLLLSCGDGVRTRSTAIVAP